MRARGARLDRAVPRLRRVEHARGGSAPAAGRVAARRGKARGRRRGRCPCATSRPSAGAARHRHRRARPGARRRARPGLAGPARRLARDRQEHADAMALANLAAAGERSSTSPARSRPPRSACAPSASARLRSACRCWPRPSSRRCSATSRPSGPPVCVVDSVQTLHCAGLSGAPGSVAQMREAAGGDHGGRQAARHRL